MRACLRHRLVSVAARLCALFLWIAQAEAAVQKIPFPNARSAYAPSIALMGETLFVTWRGAGSPKSEEDDQQLYLCAFREGQWEQPIVLGVKSMFSPALAVHGKTLYLAWHGPGNLFTGTGDATVSFGTYDSEHGFRPLGLIPKALSAGPPSLAIYNGKIFGSWRGLGNITVGIVPGNEPWVLYALYDLETHKWSSDAGSVSGIVHANSMSGPCLASAYGKLYSFWRGSGALTFHGQNRDPGDSLIYYAWFDGESWSAHNLPLPTIPGASTAWGVSATEYKGRLYAGWRGAQPWDAAAKGDQSLRFAVLSDNKNWKKIKLFPAAPPWSAFSPSLAASPEGDKLWVAWRGAYNSAQGLDDEALAVASFSESDIRE